jgi:hypothetical protein
VVLAVVHDLNARIGPAQPFGHLSRPVGGRIVDDEDLVVDVRLSEHAPHASLEQVAVPVTRAPR